MTGLWMLPDGVEETLPPASWRLEALRRRLLDDYRDAGYELILPPLIEHRDSLLTGAGSALQRQVFTLTDPNGGRLIGLRADMTPQAARIAARHFAQQPVVRLCYLGTVLRAHPDSLGGPRAPLQVGCELFGEAGIAADVEIVRLMVRSLQWARVPGVHLDLGHVGIYRAVTTGLALSTEDEDALFDILLRKSTPDLHEFAVAHRFGAERTALFDELMALHGDVGVLRRARQRLGAYEPAIGIALDAVEHVAGAIAAEFPDLPLHIDLAELRGYRYHTGLVCAAYVQGFGREIARAGRYDGAGAEYGHARPATGFSADLLELLRLGEADV